MKRWGENKGFTIGELVMVFAIVIIIGAAMWPLVRKSHRDMEKVVCANNLRELGLAMYIYAREHEGQFPPEIKTLYDEQYLADPRFTDCPASKTVGTPDNPDYIYTSGLSVRDRSLKSLVRDKAKNHYPEEGENVLYLNGTVEWED